MQCDAILFGKSITPYQKLIFYKCVCVCVRTHAHLCVQVWVYTYVHARVCVCVEKHDIRESVVSYSTVVLRRYYF